MVQGCKVRSTVRLGNVDLSTALLMVGGSDAGVACTCTAASRLMEWRLGKVSGLKPCSHAVIMVQCSFKV